MKHTVRFAHLESPPPLRLGAIVRRGDVLGKMGTSGQSSGPHLHIDCVQGVQMDRYTLLDIEKGMPAPSNPRQLNYFIDRELFGIDPIITTHYADPQYMKQYKKVHLGYDVVPSDRQLGQEHFDIRWPRSMDGKVCRVDFDPMGYGHCLYVTFTEV